MEAQVEETKSLEVEAEIVDLKKLEAETEVVDIWNPEAEAEEKAVDIQIMEAEAVNLLKPETEAEKGNQQKNSPLLPIWLYDVYSHVKV